MPIGLTLTIENMQTLPDGGPLSYALTGARGLDIGRDSHLDWTLPDPSRHVSGKHCEVRYQDGGYLLFDVSRNGTYLNGSDNRMQSPHRLRSGDRLLIGHYIVGVEVREDVPALAAAAAAPTDPFVAEEDPWGGIVGAAPPADPRDLRPVAQMIPVKPDFLEWAVDVPNAPASGFVARPAAAAPQPVETAPAGAPLDWDAGALPPPPPEAPPPPVPTPRRSHWIGTGPEGPWSDERATPPPPPVREAPVPLAPPPLAAPPVAPPRAAPPPPPPRPRAEPGDGGSLAQRFAKGAGLAPQALAAREPGDFAERLGRLMLLVTENIKQMLDARGQIKRLVRSTDQTMIAAVDNNPLKFSPTAADALATMMGPPTRSYLDAEQSLQQAFDDLKAHQVKTFAAMQRALAMLVEDLDPKAIEAGLGADRGPGKWLGSRDSRAWALFQARWEAKTGRGGNGLQDLFMRYFAECYDQAARPSGGSTGGRPSV